MELDWDKKVISARRIQACWRSYQDQKLFRFLKSSMRSAEQFLTPAVLLQLSPLEANLLRDRSLQCKVRLRFCGPQFPPAVVFKIFHSGRGGHYLSGTRLFRASDQAAADSCRMMGNRKFRDLLMEEELQWRNREISNPVDVTCLRDYIQPPGRVTCLRGGRENGWRRLNLQDLFRDRGVYSIQKKRILRHSDQPVRPLRSPAAPPLPAASSRRSARAHSVSAHKKWLYSYREEQRVLGGLELELPSSACPALCVSLVQDEDSEWEEEAEKLCCWTDQLTLETFEHLDHI